MICSYCQQARSDNGSPCPYCGAPSPLPEQVQPGSWGYQQPQNWAEQSQQNWGQQNWGQQNWESAQQPFEQPAWGQQVEQSTWGQQVEQPAWGQAVQDQQWGWSIAPEQQWQAPEQPNWSASQPQASAWNAAQPAQPEQSSPANPQMGLIPYQNNMELQASSSRTSILQLLPADLAEKMLPAIPQEEMAVYVPPIYTKPRAIIPRYRAISGMLSIIIVALLLCTGAGYAAKATGTLNTITKIVTGDSHPTPLQPNAAAALPDPKTLIQTGPAYGTIYSATTTSRVDSTGLPILPEHIFKVKQVIHLTYAVKSDKAGTIQLQWFSNGNPLADPITATFNPKDGQNKHADATIVYPLPAEGWVELRWNNQLAMKLYFVVRA